MSLSAMTFHESYGDLPKSTLTLIKRHNVSPADYDQILSAFGWEWNSDGIKWDTVNEFIKNGSQNTGFYRPSRFL